MGWMFVIGDCYGCGRTFTFNAEHVPSVVVNGKREPICAACVERANPMRIENGLEPITPHPMAYEPGEVA